MRAWLRNNPMKVLDEPTAFLDQASAHQVRSIIADRCRSRLVLVITHDSELIQQAHLLVQLNATDRQMAEKQHDQHSVQRERTHD
jgi:ABC-type transport system involved in cytochrome bd biosynthesis fused ATPase/permease subunit